LTKAGQKLEAVHENGFDGLALACPWCHKMMDSKQEKSCETVGLKARVPVFYITQLLGMTMGMDYEKLGLGLNLSPVDTMGKKETAA
jgi:heterodisulfide reductase subunit B